MAGKFEMYTDKKGESRFRLKAGNGQTILASEGYKQKASCKNGIESVRKNSQDANMAWPLSRKLRLMLRSTIRRHKVLERPCPTQGRCHSPAILCKRYAICRSILSSGTPDMRCSVPSKTIPCTDEKSVRVRKSNSLNSISG